MPALRRLEIVGNDHEDRGDRENDDEESYRDETEDEALWSLLSVTTLIVHDVTSTHSVSYISPASNFERMKRRSRSTNSSVSLITALF